MSRSFLFYTEMAFRKLLFCERILQSKVIILKVFEWVYWNIWHRGIIGVLETEVIYIVQSLSILKMLELVVYAMHGSLLFYVPFILRKISQYFLSAELVCRRCGHARTL